MASDDSVQAGEIPTSSSITIHILCPSISPTSRFTLTGLSLGSTVASLRRRIQVAIPTHPSPTEQRLIFRGRNFTTTADSSTLREVLAPIDGNEYTVHLVLPPSAAPAAPVASTTPATQPVPLPLGSSSSSTTLTSTPAIPGGSFSSSDDYDRMAPRVQPPQYLPSNSLSSTSAEILRDFRNRFNLPDIAANPLNTTAPTDTSSPPDPVALYIELHRLRNQVQAIEMSYCLGNNPLPLPSVEALHLISSRTFKIMEELRRTASDHDLLSFSEEFIFPRAQECILRLSQRHDRMARGVLPQRSTSLNTTSNPSNEVPRVYLATSPDGTQSMVVCRTSTPASPSQTAPLNRPNPAPVAARPNQANVQNVVRQALVNHQRRQNEAANGGAGAHVRRIWLFIRLYFFIYMISESGTWARILFVTAAVLVSLLSDSELPRQLLRMVLTPIQRHLERLTHFGGPAEQPEAPPRPRAGFNDMLDYLWRAERSIVLLLASLIPGIGERQVQARSTAEAEQRRVEEERRQAEENQHTEGDGQNETAPQQGPEQQQEGQQEQQDQAPAPQVASEPQRQPQLQPTIPA